MKLNVRLRTMFCRDNIDILRGINNECIDLIYLDPPFNKKKTFTAPLGSSAEGAEFSDIFREEDVKDEWVKEIEQDNPELYHLLAGIRTFSNKYNYCYCVYMAIRLIEMQRILKQTGSIYLHCDPTMSHYLKLILDCIFGEKNFRNEVIWHYFMGGKAKKFYSRKHDILLFYTKSSRYKFNPQLKKRMLDFKPTLSDPYKSEPGKKGYIGHDKFGYYSIVGMDDVWDIKGVFNMDKQYRGYPTQKPLRLLERVIIGSSDRGDVVLDPFCGCATTCVAAEKLERGWIGIDVSLKAYELVKLRLAEEVPPDLFRGEPYFTTMPPIIGKTGREYGNKKYVYIISHPKYSGEYKVGIAKNVNSRLNSFQTADPDRAYKVEYSKLTPHFNEIEKYIHNIFDNRREWVQAKLKDIKAEIEKWKPP